MFVAIPGDRSTATTGSAARWRPARALSCASASPNPPCLASPMSWCPILSPRWACSRTPSTAVRRSGCAWSASPAPTARPRPPISSTACSGTLGHRAGLLSNIRDWINDELTEARYTTGHALFLSEMMARMAAADCRYCFMEVSSHGIEEQRIAGVRFAGAIFTNLSQDHLDYHGNMAAYAKAKKAWFDGLPATAFALTNADDPRGAWMLQRHRCAASCYGLSEGATTGCGSMPRRWTASPFSIDDARSSPRCWAASTPGTRRLLCGRLRARRGARPRRRGAGGRSRRSRVGWKLIRAPDGRTAIVDYANTPDAGRAGAPAPAAGEGEARPYHHRDRLRRRRRPQPASADCGAAAALSDRVILTTDNARWEEPEDDRRDDGRRDRSGWTQPHRDDRGPPRGD